MVTDGIRTELEIWTGGGDEDRLHCIELAVTPMEGCAKENPE